MSVQGKIYTLVYTPRRTSLNWNCLDMVAGEGRWREEAMRRAIAQQTPDANEALCRGPTLERRVLARTGRYSHGLLARSVPKIDVFPHLPDHHLQLNRRFVLLPLLPELILVPLRHLREFSRTQHFDLLKP